MMAVHVEHGEAQDAAGWEVGRTAVEAASDVLGERLVSAYVIGSLAHGGFSAAVSDVDVALLVDECDAGVAPLVCDAGERTRRRLGPGLADRLSIFYGDWQTFDRPTAAARLGAIDRLDLMQHGVLVQGVDHRDAAGRVPDREELVAATAAFLAEKPLARRDPAELVSAGPRLLTKAVLFPVRFLYTYATGRAGSNEEAGQWYCESQRPAADLVRGALGWRGGVVPREEATALVTAYLPALQAECTSTFTSG
jgi:predicted nucleotidyltransferase